MLMVAIAFPSDSLDSINVCVKSIHTHRSRKGNQLFSSAFQLEIFAHCNILLAQAVEPLLLYLLLMEFITKLLRQDDGILRGDVKQPLHAI